MRALCLAAPCLAACYAPSLPAGAPCPDSTCPDGQQCVLGRCSTGAAPIDASVPGDAGDRAPFALAGLRWLAPCGATVPGDPTLCVATSTRQTVTIGGDPSRRFHVTVRIRGIGEIAPYNSGSIPGAPSWYVGGQVADDYHNDVRLTVSSPVAAYHLNNSSIDPGFVLPFDYPATFDIDGGATATFDIDPQDAVQLRNQDPGGDPMTIPGVTTTPSPYDGQFFQLDIITVQ